MRRRTAAAVAAIGTGALIAPALAGGQTDVQELDLQVVVGNLAFTPESLRAEPGTIRIVLDNPDRVVHNINLVGPGINGAVEGETVRNGQSVVTTAVGEGEYTFYCRIGAHRELGMQGILTVAQAGDGVGGEVTLSAAQLLINQRISQAAIRRLNAIEARLEGREPPPSRPSSGGGGEVTLSVGQLRINQRIAQTAVRRAATLDARLDAIEAGRAEVGEGITYPSVQRGDDDGGDEITLSATQLLINQRISQAAVRRANDLQHRTDRVV